MLDEATADWGIKVERVEMYNIPLFFFRYIVTLMLLLSYSKDARLPENLQRAMAAEAEAAREARAKVKWDFWLTTSFINGCQDKMIP